MRNVAKSELVFVPTAFVPIAEGGFADYAPANIPGIYIY